MSVPEREVIRGVPREGREACDTAAAWLRERLA